MIEIDGSQGEGGGQILRSSLSLAMITGQAVRLTQIRAGRKRPGLLRQHLTAVQAATTISQATTQGAELGSTELEFVPGSVRPGNYTFAVGTAGSASLVLQTVLPALFTADAPSKISVEGGTHNGMAPPYEFLTTTWLPHINRMGPEINLTLERYGFYPAGGGQITAEITPCPRLQPLQLTRRSGDARTEAKVISSRIPEEDTKRSLRMLKKHLEFPEANYQVEKTRKSPGPGQVWLASIAHENHSEVFSVFPERRQRPIHFVKQLTDQVREYLNTEAPVGEYCADQLMLPCALAGQSRYHATTRSRHAETNQIVIEKFLPDSIRVDNTSDGSWCFEFP